MKMGAASGVRKGAEAEDASSRVEKSGVEPPHATSESAPANESPGRPITHYLFPTGFSAGRKWRCLNRHP